MRGALRGVPAEGAARNEVRARGRLPPLKKINKKNSAGLIILKILIRVLFKKKRLCYTVPIRITQET